MSTITWNAVERIFALIGGVGGVLGIWALLRTHWLTRPKIMLLQHHAWGHTDFHRLDTRLQLGVTILVSNPRAHPNAIIRWSAEVELTNGEKRTVEVPMGELVGAAKGPLPYGTVPLALPPFSSIPTALCLFELPVDTRIPLNLTVIATDLHNRKYKGRISAALQGS